MKRCFIRTIIFGSSDGYVYAVNSLTGSLKWKFKTNGIIHSSPALYNGTVFIGSWDTYLYAIDADSGKDDLSLYSTNVNVMNQFYSLGSIVSSPTVFGNTVFFGSADGFLYALLTSDRE